MSNPTTPFSWQMPQATDLVTDLPADFEVFGQAVATSMGDLLGGTTGQVLSKTSATDMDFTWVTAQVGDITGVTAGTGISGGGTSGTVTVTNDMATTITAAGDIVVGTGSGTYDNLPIGTTAQVLTADTTVSPYKVKWATPAAAASGMTLIKQATFSSVAGTTTTFDSMFSSTYLSYVVIIDKIFAATSADDLQLQFLYSGTTQAAAYYGSLLAIQVSGSAPVTTGQSNTAQLTIYNATGTSGSPGQGYFYVNGASGSSGIATSQGMFFEGNDIGDPGVFGGRSITARTYTGFLLKSSSSNISGTISVYGMSKV